MSRQCDKFSALKDYSFPQEREHLAALQKILLLAIKVMHVSP